MKGKNTILFFVTVLMIAGFVLSSCDKYTDCTGIITVMQSKDGSIDEGFPVSGCIVIVGDSTAVTFIDTTDAKGQIRNVWKAEANLKIDAKKGNLSGTAVINLKAGEVIEQTVWLKKVVK
jgi:hypothetical protein